MGNYGMDKTYHFALARSRPCILSPYHTYNTRSCTAGDCHSTHHVLPLFPKPKMAVGYRYWSWVRDWVHEPRSVRMCLGAKTTSGTSSPAWTMPMGEHPCVSSLSRRARRGVRILCSCRCPRIEVDRTAHSDKPSSTETPYSVWRLYDMYCRPLRTIWVPVAAAR